MCSLVKGVMEAFKRLTTTIKVELEGLDLEALAEIAVAESKKDNSEVWIASPVSKPPTRETANSLKVSLDYPIACRELAGVPYIVAGSSP